MNEEIKTNYLNKNSESDSISDIYKKLSEIKQRTKPYSNYYTAKSVENRITDQEERTKKLKNDAIEQDQELKVNTLKILLYFLGVETLVIFVISFFQGFNFFDFYLDELSFRTILISTIIQITAMLTIAVQHLFPKRNS